MLFNLKLCKRSDIILTVDAHCDTIARIVKEDIDFDSHKLHINLNKLTEIKQHIQIFASFINPRECKINSLIYILQMIDRLNLLCEDYNDYIEVVTSYRDIDQIIQNDKCAAILWLEGAEALNGELSTLRTLYRLGVRGIGLTWNFQNELAYGIGEKIDKELSQFGVAVIKEMNKLGMIIDVSHLGELSFWHVLYHSNQPIIASHSSVKSICNHKRNLSDKQIVEIANKGGVIGINFNPAFLNSDEDATIFDILRHIDYIVELVGIDYVGFGSDFDGIEYTPRGVENITKINNIIEELLKRNYKEYEVKKIASQNFLRVIKQVIK